MPADAFLCLSAAHAAHHKAADGLYIAADGGEARHLVEVLGEGQQAVLEGPHAKGTMQSWRDGKELVGARKIKNPVTLELVFQFMAELKRWIDGEGGKVVVDHAGRDRRDRGQEYDVRAPESPHRLKREDWPKLAKIIQAIDLNDEKLQHYDRWMESFIEVVPPEEGGNVIYLEGKTSQTSQNPR
jgi:hypothetical protein